MSIKSLYLCAAAALALTATAADAGVIYSNGPVGAINAFSIDQNFFYLVNSFLVASSSTLTGVDFGAWQDPGDKITSIDWQITTGGLFGPVQASGSGAAVTSVFGQNKFGYDISWDGFALPNVHLAAGTYWLGIGRATTANGGLAYWDENDGPSQAIFNSPFGHGSESFDITGTGVSALPEPLTLSLFGSGLAGAIAMRRRKKKAA